jgi:RNA polymerase sigma-70 factor, ECF subfamily
MREDVTVNDRDWLAERFEGFRPHLRAVAYRMLGSASEAEDAVQEAWVRLDRSDAGGVENLGGWLTTVVGRVCLDMLRVRRSRPEPYLGGRLPDPIVTIDGDDDPEREVELADAVGPALLVVLETLSPAERLAFVLHDMFGVPFQEIAGIVGRTPTAARQLASRARRRVQGAVPKPDPDLGLKRKVVAAFLAAARSGDFDALVAVLDPEVVFRVETGERRSMARPPVVGAAAVAETVLARGAAFAPLARPAVVNGSAGAVVVSGGTLLSVVGFTVAAGRIVAIDIVADPDRLRSLTIESAMAQGEEA